jgi:CHASE2 domain-containing sensor protein/signal transduction histidine kinase
MKDHRIGQPPFSNNNGPGDPEMRRDKDARRKPRRAAVSGWQRRLHYFSRRMAFQEWLALLVLLLILAATLGSQNGLGRLDQTLYDKFLSTIPQPHHDDIILVAIDDFSLQQLGRWPWPRERHAQLINQLTAAKPRALGLDIILVEPESRGEILGAGDAALQKALEKNAGAVLPIVMINPGTGLAAGLPIPALAQAARKLGHIHLEHDSDGVVRSVFLNESLNGQRWPYFALALAQLGRPTLQPAASAANPTETVINSVWKRTQQLHIPFAASGQFQSVPYVSVLRGEVPAEFFTDKYVLVGATAMGLTDSYPTPVSGTSGAMPGVEIHANALASILDGRAIKIAPSWLAALLSMVPVLLALVGYLLLSPRLALVIAAGLLGATLMASYLSLQAGLWVAPSAAALVLMLSYPLWSWRRLEAAITYLGQEFIRLDDEPHLLPEAPSPSQEAIEDMLERRINAMKNAARRVRELRKFVSNSLDNLPDATLVTTTAGHILLANQQAKDYFKEHALTGSTLDSASIFSLLAPLATPQPIDLPANSNFQWKSLLDPQQVATLTNGVSVTDARQRDLLVKSAPCYSTTQVLTGWIVSVTDISPIRAAERSRDETLRFLSHDMRAPQASILALLELQAEPTSALSQPELFSRIEKASRRTLGLADNFVQLARAEAHEYRLDEVDFQDLLFDATDEMWSVAKGKQIEITTEIDPAHDYFVVVDRALMTRALTNLLSNAINYSPEGSRVVCLLTLMPAGENPGTQPATCQRFISCKIRDTGYGIAIEDQKKLFHRFARVDLPNQPRHDGIGLGLVFVKTVVERHAGKISLVSLPGEGTCFTLVLPGAEMSN